MTSTPANPDLLAILAAGPKPGEWCGPYRVEAYGLVPQHWRNPERGIVFTSEPATGRRACAPLGMWLGAKRTGCRFGQQHLDRAAHDARIAEAPPVGTRADGEEIVAVGLHFLEIDPMVAYRDAAGQVFAKTATDWLDRHNLRDDATGRMIAPPAAPEPEPPASVPVDPQAAKAAKAANHDAIRAMLAAGPQAGDRAGDTHVAAFACLEATADDVPEGLVLTRAEWVLYPPHLTVQWAWPAKVWQSNCFSKLPEVVGYVRPIMGRLNAAPAVGTRHRHYKGGAYEVVAVGVHVETFEVLVAYRSDETGITWARTLLDWSAAVDLPGGGLVRRFAPIGEEIPAGVAPGRPRYYQVVATWDGADCFEPGAVVAVTRITEAGCQVGRGWFRRWLPRDSQPGEHVIPILDVVAAGWGGVVPHSLPLFMAPIDDVARDDLLAQRDIVIEAGAEQGGEPAEIANVIDPKYLHPAFIADVIPGLRTWIDRGEEVTLAVGEEITILGPVDDGPQFEFASLRFTGTRTIKPSSFVRERPVPVPEPPPEAAPKYPYEAFIADGEEYLRTWGGNVTLAVGEAITILGPYHRWGLLRFRSDRFPGEPLIHPDRFTRDRPATAPDPVPEYPYEAFIAADCPEGDRNWGDVKLNIGAPVTVLRAAQVGVVRGWEITSPKVAAAGGLFLGSGWITRDNPFPYEAFVANCREGLRDWGEFGQMQPGDPMTIIGAEDAQEDDPDGDIVLLQATSPRISLESFLISPQAVTMVRPAEPKPAAKPPRIPWLPKAGDRYRNHTGREVVVGGTAYLPTVGLVVLHDLRHQDDHKHGAALVAVPIQEWHGSIRTNDYAVRRFTPID